jgi:hypothetical protein
MTAAEPAFETSCVFKSFKIILNSLYFSLIVEENAKEYASV